MGTALNGEGKLVRSFGFEGLIFSHSNLGFRNSRVFDIPRVFLVTTLEQGSGTALYMEDELVKWAGSLMIPDSAFSSGSQDVRT